MFVFKRKSLGMDWEEEGPKHCHQRENPSLLLTSVLNGRLQILKSALSLPFKLGTTESSTEGGGGGALQ
jgi:hypothetical protein